MTLALYDFLNIDLRDIVSAYLGYFTFTGEPWESGNIAVSGRVSCVNGKYSKNFSFTFSSHPKDHLESRELYTEIWKGSDCRVTVNKGSTPRGWSFIDGSTVRREVVAVSGSNTVEVPFGLVRPLMCLRRSCRLPVALLRI